MTPPQSTLLALVALLAACAPSTESPAGSSEPEGSLGRPAQPDRGDGPDDTDADTDTDADSDTDSDTDGDTGGGDSGQPGTSEPVRFVAIGDAGTGRDEQYAVAGAVAQVCASKGCDFALYLGDNFYSDGVSSVDDSQFEEKFEAPYAGLSFPFYAVLGNHDYGDGGGGYDVYRTEAEVEYTLHSEKWVMPDQFYTHVQGDVAFFGLDTTALDWGNTEEQQAWLPGAISGATTTWKIAYGHHPYVSNGSHGNANDNFGPFVEENLCGKVDVYMSGHDHSLQWLESPCGTEFIVSGAGAKLTDVGSGDNGSWFEESTYGFLWVEIAGTTFTGTFFDSEGTELYTRSFTKQ